MAWYPCLYNSGGGGGILGEKTISTYGVYNASSDNLDGYSKVTNITGLETATASGAVASISDAVAMPCPSVVANIDYTAQGVTGTTVTRCGKNLMSPPTFSASTESLCLDLGRDISGISVTLSFLATNAEVDNVTSAIVDFRESDGTHHYRTLNDFKDSNNISFSASGQNNGMFKYTSSYTFRYVYISYTSNWRSKFTSDSLSNWQLEIGSSATAYEAYTAPTTYTADFERTIYGGNYDFVSGVLTEDTDSNGDPISPPNVYNLTGQTITTAQGVNNFYADTGDTAATYYRVATGDSYLYNTYAVYINTGYIHKANTKLVLDCEPWRDAGSYAVLCGARAGSYANNAMLFFSKFNGNRYGWSRTGQEEVTDYWDNLSGNYAWYDTRCIITMEGNICTVLNAASRETRTITCANATVNDGIAPIALFCDNNSSSAGEFASQDWSMMKFYSLKIYESDVLVHNFVPAYNNNQYCIYDLVDQVYKYDLYDSGRYLNGYISSHEPEPEPEPVKIERLFYFEGDQDDDVRIPTAITLDEGDRFSEYLSYDTTTNKFTVLKAFSAMVTGWVYQFQSASGYGTGQFIANSVAKMTYQVPSTSSGSKGGTTGVFDFAVGDTFWPYQNSSSGWPQQFLKVYLVKNLDFTDVIELDDETT